jgi:S-adenosylmethionine-diacylglycerol 3-amino-3-carboxypropyl transferase
MPSKPAYFSGLNYTLANEDTALELALLRDGCDTVLTVAGSGSRVLPLLARAPRRLVCVDLSLQQLQLTELRLALAREAPLEDFLSFMGYPLAADSSRGGQSERDAALLRQKYIEHLELAPVTRQFLKDWFESIDWRLPLYEGRWERTFKKLSAITRALLGRACEELMECRTLSEQSEFLRSRFPKLRWELVLGLLGNAAVFNALLYKGSFPNKNIPGSRRRFYGSRYARLLSQAPARQNFFLQLTFLGRLRYPEGNPIECRPEVYSAAKTALQGCEVELVQGDVVSVAARQLRRPADFLSFSDVPSYFSGNLERGFLKAVEPGLSAGAQVVLRHYLHHPVDCDRGGYSDETPAHEAAILAEKVGVYDVEVLSRRR